MLVRRFFSSFAGDINLLLRMNNENNLKTLSLAAAVMRGQDCEG